MSTYTNSRKNLHSRYYESKNVQSVHSGKLCAVHVMKKVYTTVIMVTHLECKVHNRSLAMLKIKKILKNNNFNLS